MLTNPEPLRKPQTPKEDFGCPPAHPHPAAPHPHLLGVCVHIISPHPVHVSRDGDALSSIAYSILYTVYIYCTRRTHTHVLVFIYVCMYVCTNTYTRCIHLLYEQCAYTCTHTHNIGVNMETAWLYKGYIRTIQWLFKVMGLRVPTRGPS